MALAPGDPRSARRPPAQDLDQKPSQGRVRTSSRGVASASFVSNLASISPLLLERLARSCPKSEVRDSAGVHRKAGVTRGPRVARQALQGVQAETSRTGAATRCHALDRCCSRTPTKSLSCSPSHSELPAAVNAYTSSARSIPYRTHHVRRMRRRPRPSTSTTENQDRRLGSEMTWDASTSPEERKLQWLRVGRAWHKEREASWNAEQWPEAIWRGVTDTQFGHYWGSVLDGGSSARAFVRTSLCSR